MAKKSKSLTAILIIIFAVAAVFGVRAYLEAQKTGLRKGALARVKGSDNAPIQIIEFIDFQCPACAKGFGYLKEFETQNPNKLRVEIKYFPLEMHPHAYISAHYAECAAKQDKFWPFVDKMFQQQPAWRNLIDARPAFEMFAKDAKLDMNSLHNCLQNKDVDAVILTNKKEGGVLGIRSTPTYFVNGQMIVGTDSLEKTLKGLLDAKKN